jgi:hypothetical protein
LEVRLFCGFDSREQIGFHVFVSSVLERATVPVAIHPLGNLGMDEGSNAFTFSRFLVPWLCHYAGRAIFADASDMLMLADIAELAALFDITKAVQVVQHRPYRTRHPIKYVGTCLQCPNVDYARKQWASVMLINCAHPAWAEIDPPMIDAMEPRRLLQFGWMDDADIGELPDRWNRVVDEGQPVEGAALLHYTAGLPAFPHYRSTPGADAWHAQHARMMEIA